MASAKLITVLLLAFAATSQSASVPHESRTLGDVIENVVGILDIIITAVQDGIEKADPLLNNINDELNPALGDFIVDIRDRLKEDVDRIVARLNTLSKEVSDALAQIRGTVKSCLDAAVGDVDPVLDDAEAQLAEALTKVQADNREDLDDLYNNLDLVTLGLDNLIDTAIAESLVCVIPGSSGVKACLDDKLNTLVTGVQSTILDLGLVLAQAIDVVSTVVGQGVNASKPIINATIDNLQAPNAKFGECVEGLKLVKLY